MATPGGSGTGTGTDAGEGTSKYRGESSGTANTLLQQTADLSLDSPPPPQPSNWENVLNSLNLFVDAHSFPQVMVKDIVTGEHEMRPCYNLEDLWTTLHPVSIYGAGVPLKWGEHSVIQYFMPTLSGMQLYVDSPDPETWLRVREERRKAKSLGKTPIGGSSGCGADKESDASGIKSSIAEAEVSRKVDIGESRGGAYKEPVTSILSSSTAEAESSRKSDIGRNSTGGIYLEPVTSVLRSSTAEAESPRKSHTGGSSSSGVEAESSRKSHIGGSSSGGAYKEPVTSVLRSSTAEAESPRKSHTGGSSSSGVEAESARKSHTGGGCSTGVDAESSRTSHTGGGSSSGVEAESSRKSHTGGRSSSGVEAESSRKIHTDGSSSSGVEAESSRKSHTGGSSSIGVEAESSRKSHNGGSSSSGLEAESPRKRDIGGSSTGGAYKEPVTSVLSSSTSEAESPRKSHSGGSSSTGVEAESSSKSHTGGSSRGGAEAESSRKAETSPVISLPTTEAVSSRTILMTDFEADKEPDSTSVVSPITVEFDSRNTQGTLLLHHLDMQLPFNRPPLTDQITEIYKAFSYPEITSLTSIDLLPSSWIAVAWYPAYKVPSGLTLKDLSTAFLTFHFLSTRTKCSPLHVIHPVPARNETLFGVPARPLRLSIPLFGLASYKMGGSVVAPTESYEIEQENNLLSAAESWLRSLNIYLKDFGFFRSQYYRRWQ